jgi:cell division GTPase FtsZ
MSLYEVNQAAAIIRETAHPDANMIFGAVIDENMGDEMRITVIATGFERSLTRRQLMQQQYVHPAAPVTTAPPRQSTARRQRLFVKNNARKNRFSPNSHLITWISLLSYAGDSCRQHLVNFAVIDI